MKTKTIHIIVYTSLNDTARSIQQCHFLSSRAFKICLQRCHQPKNILLDCKGSAELSTLLSEDFVQLKIIRNA